MFCSAVDKSLKMSLAEYCKCIKLSLFLRKEQNSVYLNVAALHFEVKYFITNLKDFCEWNNKV